MALAKVLKAFPYAHDGIKNKMLAVGSDPVEIREDLFDGLKAEGLIEPWKEAETPKFDPAKAKEDELRAFLADRQTAIPEGASLADLRKLAVSALKP